jgi:hypothetical protein
MTRTPPAPSADPEWWARFRAVSAETRENRDRARLVHAQLRALDPDGVRTTEELAAANAEVNRIKAVLRARG